MSRTLDEMRQDPCRNVLFIHGPRMGAANDGMARGQILSTMSQTGLAVGIIGDGIKAVAEDEVIEAVARQPANSLIVLNTHGTGYTEDLLIELDTDGDRVPTARLFSAIASATDRAHSYLITSCGGETSHESFARTMMPGNVLASIGGLKGDPVLIRNNEAFLSLSSHVGSRTGVSLDNLMTRILLVPDRDTLTAKFTFAGAEPWDLMEQLSRQRGKCFNLDERRRIESNLQRTASDTEWLQVSKAITAIERNRDLARHVDAAQAVILASLPGSMPALDLQPSHGPKAPTSPKPTLKG